MDETNNLNKKLYIQLYSIHGLIRGNNLELGRDADTGGQTKYVVELAKALSTHPDVEKVELITRLIKDKNVSPDYSNQIEKVNDKFSIVRIQCDGGKYIRKELLWNHLEEFIDKSIKYIKAQHRLPDIIHSHYADAGYVCSELAKFFGIPLIHTGHSLGKSKLKKLLSDGMMMEDVEKRFKITHRINVEEEVFYYSDLIVTCTNQEIKEQYGEYQNITGDKFVVIPPGVDLEKFYPFEISPSVQREILALRDKITDKLLRFFMDIDKPLILTLCRPAKRKNISGLITAYGEDEELQKKANLAIFAGIREDIQTMEENEREVLTEILLLMDKYNLYGKMAIPKRHDSEHEVPELYRIAAETGGVFVNAALTEPFGLTLIEAAACGLPVVATNDGGPRDIIKNCRNGILVDVSDSKNIASALTKLLDDNTLWETYSFNGIFNVEKYYTWKAHVDSYLIQIKNLLSKNTASKNYLNLAGKKLFGTDKLIMTDIDNTLLGDENSLTEFTELMKCLPRSIGFGVAKGRTVQSTLKILEENNVPLPDLVISSVGSEIYYNHKGELIYSKGWDAHISHMWRRQTITDLLSRFDFLRYQEEDTQRKFKISYYMEENEENLNKVKEVLFMNKIRFNLIYSHGQFLDILPYRASKGKAIRYLSYRWNIPYENILVAGDSGNDEDMLKGEMLGVIVANYSHELEVLRERKRIYFSKRAYAGGIIDGIEHYDFLSEGKEN